MMWAHSIVLLALIQVNQVQAEGDVTRVFMLKYAQANQAASILTQLGTGGEFMIVPDARTNSLLFKGTNAELEKVSQLIDTLDRPGEQPEMKMFHLPQLEVASAVSVVQKLLGNKQVTLVPVANTNLIVAQGSHDDLETVKDLLRNLDEVEVDNSLRTAVYPLKFMTAREAATHLNSLSMRATVAADERTNSLIFRADRSEDETIRGVLRLLDVAEPSNGIQLRVVWLVSERIAGQNAPAPPADLASMVADLRQRLSLDALRTATQVLINIDESSTSGHQEFTAEGTATLQGDSKFKVSGSILDMRQRLISIRIDVRDLQQDHLLCSLATTLSTPLGHPVVLGVSSIWSAESVFVIQLLPEDAAGATK